MVLFLAVQLISWVASIYFEDVPMLKGGVMLFLFLVIIAIVSLFVLGRRLGQLDLKKDLPFVLLVFGGIIAAFIFLPQVVPQIFSTQALEMSETIKRTINSVIGLSPGGIYVG
jgi:uncharacterized protein with PQ loop repeat